MADPVRIAARLELLAGELQLAARDVDRGAFDRARDQVQNLPGSLAGLFMELRELAEAPAAAPGDAPPGAAAAAGGRR